MNNTHTHTDTHIHKQKLSLRPPDNGSCSSITNTPPNTPPNTPVLNPNLLKTKHLSIDIPKWNDFDETNNQIPTMDVSPIYANNNNNNPYSRKSTGQSRKSTQQNQTHTNHSPDNSHRVHNRSCLMQILLYLFGGDSQGD